MAHSKFKGVLFDIDGTLIDSNDAHAHAWVEALAEKGYKTSFEKVRELIGKGGDKVLPEVAGQEKDNPVGKAISQRRAAIFKEKYLPDLRPLPGAHDLLQALHDRGMKLGIATSAQPDEMEELLKIAQANHFFDQKASSKDASRSKPDPDVVQAALDKLNLTASEVVMIGDTPYDIEGASKAGVAAIGLRSGGWPDDKLKGAIAVYDDPADLLKNFEF